MTVPLTPPDISATAFVCPHCSAYTTQNWFNLAAEPIRGESRTPFVVDEEFASKVAAKKGASDGPTPEVVAAFKALATQRIMLFRESRHYDFDVGNLNVSQCYNCKKVAVWVYRTLIYPEAKQGALPNPDLPDNIQADYEEARSICAKSPRGAAALLRLCIQKLCKHLGETGSDINKDIGRLVSKGLNPTIKNALDIVRVIGNESVHPGVMDLKDDQATATQLFGLVNLIAEQMITVPKHVAGLYGQLPEAKRKAIDVRDAKIKKDNIDGKG